MSTAEQIAVKDYDSMIAVIQAAKERKPIEARPHHPKNGRPDWKLLTEPGFNFDEFDYRVAEEREGEPWSAAIWIKESRRPILASSVHSAQHSNLIETGWRLTTLVELPDGWEVRRKATQTVRVVPNDIPHPPQGFDYWGVGPLPHTDNRGSHDIAMIMSGWDRWDTTGWAGGIERHYAIKRGTELHRLNFETDAAGRPLP